MPWIIEYSSVTEELRRQGLRCLYYNSGAFGFADGADVKFLGLIGAEDSTLRPAARAAAQRVGQPYESTLAAIARAVWQETLPGRAWVMPMSHWAYELQFGAGASLAGALEKLEIDPGLLHDRNNGSAIEFGPEETAPFEGFVCRLLEILHGSDFLLAFPGRPALCTIHHHKQLWWQTTDGAIHESLEKLSAECRVQSAE